MKSNPYFKKSFGPGLLLACMVYILILSCQNCPGKKDKTLPTREEAIDAVLTKIELENDRWADGDPMGFVDNAAEDILWVDDLDAPLPIRGKDSLRVYLEGFQGKIPPHEHELSDMVFQYYGDILIISYRYVGSNNGVPATPWKVTSVFRYADGDWLSVHENWSLVKKTE